MSLMLEVHVVIIMGLWAMAFLAMKKFNGMKWHSTRPSMNNNVKLDNQHRILALNANGITKKLTIISSISLDFGTIVEYNVLNALV